MALTAALLLAGIGARLLWKTMRARLEVDEPEILELKPEKIVKLPGDKAVYAIETKVDAVGNSMPYWFFHRDPKTLAEYNPVFASLRYDNAMRRWADYKYEGSEFLARMQWGRVELIMNEFTEKARKEAVERKSC